LSSSFSRRGTRIRGVLRRDIAEEPEQRHQAELAKSVELNCWNSLDPTAVAVDPVGALV